MYTNFGRFKMLALRTMAGDEHKDDVNNATSSFRWRSMTFCMRVGLYDGNQHCIYTWTEEITLKHFVPSFVRPGRFDAYVVKRFALV